MTRLLPGRPVGPDTRTADATDHGKRPPTMSRNSAMAIFLVCVCLCGCVCVPSSLLACRDDHEIAGKLACVIFFLPPSSAFLFRAD